MKDLYPDMIREHAIKAAESYINNDIPLSDSIASFALANSYNPDQIKRIVEATNQLTYLKLQTMTKDRTFEFPLAKYEDIMSKLVDDGAPIEKAANASPRSPLDIINDRHAGELVKEAQEESEKEAMLDAYAGMSDAEKIKLVSNELHKQAQVLKHLESECDIMVSKLTDATVEAAMDPYFLEKLATVADEHQVAFFTSFASGITKQARQLGLEEGMIFTKSALSEVENLCALHIEAQGLIEKKAALTALVSGGVRAIKAIGRGVGKSAKKMTGVGTTAAIAAPFDYTSKTPVKKQLQSAVGAMK